MSRPAQTVSLLVQAISAEAASASEPVSTGVKSKRRLTGSFPLSKGFPQPGGGVLDASAVIVIVVIGVFLLSNGMDCGLTGGSPGGPHA
jgi:hypothetical protein